MKTTNLMMDKGTAMQSVGDSEAKGKFIVADRKVSPFVKLKVKTPSFGEALEDARANKGTAPQTKASVQKASTAQSDESKTTLTKAEPKDEALKPQEKTAPESVAEKMAESKAETAVLTQAEKDSESTASSMGLSAKADKSSKEADKATEEMSAEVLMVPVAQAVDVMYMAMPVTSLENTPMADASAIGEKMVMSRDAVPLPMASLPTEAQPMALDALLPQDATKIVQASQNQQLMEMLSGSVPRIVPETAPKSSWGTEPLFAAETLPTGLVFSKAESTKVPTGKASERLAAQSLTAVSEAAIAFQKETLDPAVSAGKRPAENLWQGIGLAVEDTIALPLAAADVGDMAGETPQRDPKSPAALTEVSGTVVRQGSQLTEEAAFDTVEITEGNQTDSTSQSVVSAFTPAVGLTNAAGTAGATAAPAADGYEVVRQIVEQAKLVRTDGNASEMVIRLKPEHLGELTMRISVASSGAVNASFHTDNPQTRGLIESSMVQLKQELSAQGIKVDNVSVYSGLSEDFFANSQAGQQGYPQPQHGARSEKADRIAFTGDVEAVSGVERGALSSLDPNVGTADGVDYRV